MPKTYEILRQEALQIALTMPAAAFLTGSHLARWEGREDGLTVADGEAGRGTYFFFARDRAMSDYYEHAREGCRLAGMTLGSNDQLADFTHPQVAGAACAWLTDYSAYMGTSRKWGRRDFQRAYWGLTALTAFIREGRPAVVGIVVPHVVPGLSNSKQVVVAPDAALLAA